MLQQAFDPPFDVAHYSNSLRAYPFLLLLFLVTSASMQVLDRDS